MSNSLKKRVTFFSVFLLLSVISSMGFSADDHSNGFKDFELAPGGSILISNTLATSVTVQCEIIILSSQNNSVLIKVLTGNGIINGTHLKRGQSLVQTLYHSQVVLMTASADATAQFTNLGYYVLKSTCN